MAREILGQEPPERLVALGGRQVAQVEVLPGQGDPVDHDLHWLTACGADEPGPQAGVPVQQRLTGHPHPLGVNLSGQVEDQLDLVGVERRAGQRGVEEQP